MIPRNSEAATRRGSRSLETEPMKQPAHYRVTSSSSALQGMGGPSTTMKNRGTARGRQSL